jgi:5-methyltetrahydrofolate--homocysteine methyltransferase
MIATIQKIFDAILEGDAETAKEQVQAALAANLEPSAILNEGMIAAMSEVGRQFEAGDFFVPEMLISARAMQGCMAILKPFLQQSGVRSSGKVVIGTVKGDLHDIGKNLVTLMLEGAGYAIIDLGTDVPAEEFVKVVQNEKPDILALSALLTTTMPAMKMTLEYLVQAGLRDKVKVLVGGAPVTEAYARQIGADGYAPDASRAVAVAKSLVG